MYNTLRKALCITGTASFKWITHILKDELSELSVTESTC